MSLFFDGDVLKKELLGSDAEQKAGEFVVYKNGRRDDESSITKAQLRRFYGEFKGLEKKYRNNLKPESDKEAEFRKLLPIIKMVKSKVTYSEGTRKVPKKFADWLIKYINEINSPAEFEAFLLYFEAVVGFCYGLRMKES